MGAPKLSWHAGLTTRQSSRPHTLKNMRNSKRGLSQDALCEAPPQRPPHRNTVKALGEGVILCCMISYTRQQDTTKGWLHTPADWTACIVVPSAGPELRVVRAGGIEK